MLEVRVPHKGGTVSVVERRRRMMIIEGLFLEFHQVDRVARMCAAGFDMPDGTRFRTSRSSALKYIKQIEERWIAEAEGLRPVRLELHRRSIINDIRSAKGDKKWSAVGSLRRLLADVDGVAVQNHRVEHEAGAGLLVMFANWTVADKRRYAETGRKPGESYSVDDDFPFDPPCADAAGSNGKSSGVVKPATGSGNGSST